VVSTVAFKFSLRRYSKVFVDKFEVPTVDDVKGALQVWPTAQCLQRSLNPVSAFENQSLKTLL
jgi:hypothetical protein